MLSENDLDLLDEEEGEQTREIQKLQRARPRLFSAGGGADLWEWEWGDGSGLGYVKVSRENSRYEQELPETGQG